MTKACQTNDIRHVGRRDSPLDGVGHAGSEAFVFLGVQHGLPLFSSFQFHDEFANFGLKLFDFFSVSELSLLPVGLEIGLSALDKFVNPSIDLGLFEIVLATDINQLAFFFEELEDDLSFPSCGPSFSRIHEVPLS